MQNLSDFKALKKIYFIGIGGISLSGLSEIAKSYGIEVCGSDEKPSEITKMLEKNGIKVYKKHRAKNVKNFDPSLVVYSLAVHDDNVELKYAKENNILCLSRAEFLGELLKNYKNVISISGTHGKTTTTTMISEIFLKAGKNPTVHIGGESVNYNTSAIVGDKDYFITEACEYKRAFLRFNSSLGVILNIEEDHPDCYKNISEIYDAFFQFSKICSSVVINIDYLKNNFNENDKNLITFGTKNGTFTAKSIKKLNTGFSFSVFKNGEFYERFKLNVFGRHNILNALASICVSDYYNIDKQLIKQALSEFKGVKRRFEKVQTNKFLGDVYFDYAHHPTEIKKLLSEVKSLNKAIICVFQPHTYSRTKKYFNEFLSAFSETYQTIFYKTYKAREKKSEGLSAKDLYKALKNKHNVYYYNNFNSIINHLKKYSKPNCVVLFVGAGDIYDIKSMIVN